jgi:DMSO/TMAO reductase YedYZ heme-binding membrane subunit
MNGWPLVGWATLAVGAIVGAVLAWAGTGEAGLRMAIRATARTSIAFFVLAFTASAVLRRWPGPAGRWLIGNRRALGLAFAASQLVHLVLILALVGWTIDGLVAEAGAAALVLGGIGYVFVIVMAATSSDAAVRLLGARAWRRLHVTGLWYLWIVFFASFVPRAFTTPAYVPVAVLLVAALWLRLATPARRAADATSRAA